MNVENNNDTNPYDNSEPIRSAIPEFAPTSIALSDLPEIDAFAAFPNPHNLNKIRLARTLGHILTHPETHDQGHWSATNCKTTACLAGWGAMNSGRPVIRRNPWGGTSDYVMATQADIDNPNVRTHRIHHWVPTPAFTEQLREWSKTPANDREGFRPEANENNHTAKIVQAVDIRTIARDAFGFSEDMANFFFGGSLPISTLSMGITMLLSGWEWNKVYTILRDRMDYTTESTMDDLTYAISTTRNALDTATERLKLIEARTASLRRHLQTSSTNEDDD